MHRMLRLIALAFCLFVHPALAQTSPATLPPEIAKAQADLRRECNGKAVFEPGFQTTADINGDGLPDYFLDYGKLDCDGTRGMYCGSAGCTLDIYVSSGGRYVQGYGTNTQGWSIDRSGDRATLVMELHGSACGRIGAQGCERRMAWNGKEFVAARSNAAGGLGERRWSEFYCKTPDTIEREHANDPDYRVKLPPPNVRPELAYEIFRHGSTFAFPAPGGDPSEIQTVSGVRFASKGDTVTITARSGHRWTVVPAGGAVVTVSGQGLKRPITGRGCVWR